jgi:very-short-patch-repair endonuclease
VGHVQLLDLAARQHGLVEWSQAQQVVTEKWLRHATGTGRLIRVLPAVYRVAGAPITREQILLAACLAAGPDSAVSHRCAATEWGLVDSYADVIEIVTPRPHWPRLPGVFVHRSTDLAAHHVTARHGVPITKPLRTLVDLGAVVPAAVVSDALELGLSARLFHIRAADAALDEFGCKGRSGVGVFRRVIDDRALERGIPDGLLEPRMARLLRRFDLPAAAFQHWVTPKIRVDFAYVERRIVIEVDGFKKRNTPERMAADLDRQNQLVLLGWTVLRFTWRQVVKEPEKVAKTILVTLTAPEGRSA